MRATQSLAALTVLSAGLASACGNELQPMGRGTPRAEAPYLGPIPAGFRNDADAATFQTAAGVEAGRLEAALRPFAPLRGLAPAGGEAGALRDMSRCGNLRAVMGGFLSGADLARHADPAQGFQLRGQSCADALAWLGGSFTLALEGAKAQARNLSSFGLAEDDCTEAQEGRPTAVGAVGYDFRVRDGGSYLTEPERPLRFAAALEGGAGEGRLALRAEMHALRGATVEGAREEQRHWVGVATLGTLHAAEADPQGGKLVTHKGELLERWRRAADGTTSEDSLARRSVVTLTYGAVPQVVDETVVTRFEGDRDVDSWSVRSVIAPKDGGVEVQMEMTRAGTTEAARLVVASAGGCEIVAP